MKTGARKVQTISCAHAPLINEAPGHLSIVFPFSFPRSIPFLFCNKQKKTPDFCQSRNVPRNISKPCDISPFSKSFMNGNNQTFVKQSSNDITGLGCGERKRAKEQTTERKKMKGEKFCVWSSTSNVASVLLSVPKKHRHSMLPAWDDSKSP